jgi:hypothetical protein
MTVEYWLGIILTTLSILALVASAVKWYIKVQVQPIKEAVEDIRSETKTNGGSSMRDEIKFIKKEQEEAKKLRKATSDKLDHMYDLFVDYVSRNSK